MAAAALCRRFSRVLKWTGAAWEAPSPRVILDDLRKNVCKTKAFLPSISLHTSLPRSGLEEFFDDPKNWGKAEIKSALVDTRDAFPLRIGFVESQECDGDSWTVEQLRGKSSEDLHKLWYVLLKERNMLLTLEQEAKRQRLPMPSPERLEKVKDSMERMDLVIQEREDALRLLQTGQENERPGEWRYDFLGRPIWYTFREWPIPWYMNARHNRKRFFYLPNVKPFIRLRLEKYLRRQAQKKSLQKKKEKLLLKKFPHLSKQS